MPFSFGLDPYFNVSSLGGVRFEGVPSDCLNHLTMAPASTAEQMQRLDQMMVPSVRVVFFSMITMPSRIVNPRELRSAS